MKNLNNFKFFFKKRKNLYSLTKHYLKSKSSTYFLSRVVGIITQFLIMRLAANRLSPNEAEIWFLNSSLLPLIGLCDLGVGNMIVSKATIIFQKKGERELKKFVNSIIQMVTVFTFFLTFLILIIFFSLSNQFSELADQYNDFLPAILAFIIFSILSIPPNSSLQACLGTNRVKFILGSLSFSQSIFLISFFTTIDKGLNTVAIYSFGSMFLANWISYYIIWGNIFGKIRISKIKKWIEFVKESFPYLLIQFTLIIQLNLDTIFVAKYSSIKDVPIFVVTQKIYLLPILVLTSFLNIIWVKVTKLKSEDNKSLYVYFFSVLKKSILIGLFFAFSTYLLAPVIIKLISDSNYKVNYSLLIIFSLYLIVNSVIGTQSSLLNGLRKINIQIFFSAYNTILNPVLSILLCNYIGLIGPILATLIVNSSLIILYQYYINKKNLLSI